MGEYNEKCLALWTKSETQPPIEFPKGNAVCNCIVMSFTKWSHYMAERIHTTHTGGDPTGTCLPYRSKEINGDE